MKTHLLKSLLPMAIGAAGAAFAILYPTYHAAFCGVSSLSGL